MPMIAKDLLVKDRASFFDTIFNRQLSLEDLTQYYISYLGPIFGDQKEHFKRRFATFLAERDIDVSKYDLIKPDGGLSEAFITEFFPALDHQYYRPAPIDDCLKLELLPGGENELRNDYLPLPYNHRTSRPNRRPFALFTRARGNLFVGPQGYQYFDEGLGCFWPQAATRPYSKAITTLPRLKLPGFTILIQDTGSGTNFAHFTYDWVTRIMHILSSGLFDKNRAHFIMGGDRTQYHDLILGLLKTMFQLRDDQFFFPPQRMVLDVTGHFFFFSDQLLWNLHPAQMGHRCSIALLDKLTAALPPAQPTGAERVFISRADALLRKIDNEDELIAIAQARGFQVVRMSEHSAQHQIDLIRNARILAGAHGMGFTPMIFNGGPLHLLELFHPRFGTDAYALMARAKGFQYSALIGELVDVFKASYRIDPALFAAEIDRIIQLDTPAS